MEGQNPDAERLDVGAQLIQRIGFEPITITSAPSEANRRAEARPMSDGLTTAADLPTKRFGVSGVGSGIDPVT